jgi:uncharacterized membrane protein
MQLPPRRLLASYLTALACFLALDACWLTLVGPHLYRPALDPHLAASVDWRAAVLFYALYIGGLLVFAIAPAIEARSAALGLRRGALLGLFAYATYDLTNQATLTGWPWAVTFADMAWGTFVSAAASWAAARWFTRPSSPRRR